MAVDFTAIDFETANGFRGSACSVGLVKVRDSRVVDTDYWVMRPPEGFDHFDARNVQIHGIRPEDVEGAPRFAATYERLAAFVGDDVLLAHNAAFDVGVIKAGLQASGAAGVAVDYGCTVKLARRTYDLASYSLPFAAAAAGYELTSHHEALADAEACAHIAIDAARRHGADSVNALFDAVGLGLGHQDAFAPGDPECAELVDARGWRAAGHVLPKQPGKPWPTEGPNPEPNAQADPSNPLFGETLVFTGDLGVPRPEAKVRAAIVGARTADRVTRATTVLVVGDGFVPEDLTTGRLTRKARHVLALRDQGRKIHILSEPEFLQAVGGSWPEGR
ncbi:exonuclease [Galactobacter valiniphilus]|uniref:Exonuclease n=1 Tax=Galactobacter valiniphilus TaxID=2676122 RepID=A0A399JBU0_9MICC|nr:exonuclease domain-containing protein [Galactobacter valiniphilus]RII42704.1 exonuclease [Galactobacter valiniphilus]